MKTILFSLAMIFASTFANAQFTGAVNVLNENGQAINRFMDASITPDGAGSIVRYESMFVKFGERVKYLDYTMDGNNHTVYIQRDVSKNCELTTHWNGNNLMYVIFVAYDSKGQVYDRWQWFPNCEITLRRSTAVN